MERPEIVGLAIEDSSRLHQWEWEFCKSNILKVRWEQTLTHIIIMTEKGSIRPNRNMTIIVGIGHFVGTDVNI